MRSTAGGGILSDTTATTDANGRAATWLTLGIEAGTNAIAATVEGLEPVTFTATAQESPFASLFDLFQSGKRVALPDHPQLAQNAPNPFNSQTVLPYFLPAAGPARVEVFALTGQRVAVLHQGPQSAGHHRLYWNGLDAEGRPSASGIYLYRLATDFGILTRKLMLPALSSKKIKTLLSRISCNTVSRSRLSWMRRLAALSLERRLCSASWSRSSFFNSSSPSRCRIPVVMGSSGVA